MYLNKYLKYKKKYLQLKNQYGGNKNLVIPDSTLKIQNSEYTSSNLTSVFFHNNVLSIGDYSFANNKLTEINIPNSVIYIGKFAFFDNEIKKIIIPERFKSQVTEIFGLSSFSNIFINYTGTIKENVITIKNELVTKYSFDNKKITLINILPTVKRISKNAFSNNYLSSLEIPSSVVFIGDNAFSNNQLLFVKIPNKFNSDSEKTRIFGYHHNIEFTITEDNNFKDDGTLIIAKGTERIYKNSFSNFGLKVIKIPNSVIKIDHNSFDNNPLKEVTMPDRFKIYKNKIFGSALNIQFNYTNNDKIISSPLTDLQIISSAFLASTCKNISGELKIQEGTIEIYDSEFYNNDINLVSIPPTVTTINNYSFAGNCIDSLIIPDSVISIGDFAFAGNKITKLKLSSNIKSIGDCAFSGNNLKVIEIPESVISIGTGAFVNNNLETVIISKKFEFDIVRIFGTNTNINFKYILTILEGPSKIKADDGYQYQNLFLVRLPNTVTKIDSFAFENNQIEKITFGNSIQNISVSAFANNKITNLDIPNSVTNIDSKAFENNQIEKITFGNSLENIDTYAFANNRLTKLDIPNSVIRIGLRAFENNRLTKIIIPDSVKNIGNDAFIGNPLQEVELSLGWENHVSKIFSNYSEIYFKFIMSVTYFVNSVKLISNKFRLKINFIIRDGKRIFNINSKENVFETLYQNNKELLKNIPYVIFINKETLIQDKGIDSSGLTTTVFHLLSEYINTNFFIMFQDFHTIPDRDFDEDRIFFLGQLFAYAIRIGQQINIDLHPFIIYQIIFDDFKELNYENILRIINKFNKSLLDEYPYSCFKNPITDKYCNWTVEGEDINFNVKFDDGKKNIKKIISTVFSPKEELVNITEEEKEERRKKEAFKGIKIQFRNSNIKKFIEGFRSQIDINKNRLYLLDLLKFSQVISGSKQPLTYEDLIKYIQFINFNNEEQKNVIKELIREKLADPNWIKRFLLNLTSKEKIPITGIKLTIQLSSGNFDAPFKTSVCFNTMIINPVLLNDYMNSTNKSQHILNSEFNFDNVLQDVSCFTVA